MFGRHRERQLCWCVGGVTAHDSIGTTSSNMPASGVDSTVLVHADAHTGFGETIASAGIDQNS